MLTKRCRRMRRQRCHQHRPEEVCAFRRKADTQSGAKRTLIPGERAREITTRAQDVVVVLVGADLGVR